MVSYAYPKAFTIANITSGFRATGIFPMDPNIFPEDRFLPSYSTDRPAPSNPSASVTTTPPNDHPPAIILSSSIPPSSTLSNGQPSTPNNKIHSTLVSPKDIRPLQKVGERKAGARKRKAVKSTILTLTPEKRPQCSYSLSAASSLKPAVLTYDSESDDDANARLEQILHDDDDVSVDEIVDHEDFDDLAQLSTCLSDEEVRRLIVGDFVFLECKGNRSQMYYYTGMLAKEVDEEGDLEVEFFKRSEKVRDKFVSYPNKDETCSAAKN
ncbi:hypothetical protein EGW08_023820 [Elysia chlorotica]|uniref:Uncharacterized protein n=1 Tax=Elysia chlorotica TaxID=188477 RepID=A0A3S1AU72_ELYCH|nr:hypothetical protein EGW08_023820 [Elysia chlorotica]